MKKQNLFQLFLVAVMGCTILTNTSTVFAQDQSQQSFETFSQQNASEMQEDFEEYASKHEIQVNDNSESLNRSIEKETNQKNDNYLYLSDIDYDSSSKNGWRQFQKDKNVEEGTIRLLLDDKIVSFHKGMGAHANSKLIYDISKYKNKFTHLSTYIGINYRDNSQSDGVEFVFYGSNSKTGNWKQLGEKYVLRPYDKAQYVKLDIHEYNYILLESNGLRNIAADHSVYADLRLLKSGYRIEDEHHPEIKTLAEYDREITKHTVDYNYQHNQALILKREFVKRIGYHALQNAYRANPKGVKETLDWLFQTKENLQLFIEAGDYFSGSGENAFHALVSLYTTYRADMNQLAYKKMLLATAAAYSKDVHIFLFNYGGQRIKTDPIKKYQYFKTLYDKGGFVRKEEFNQYPMELVRAVMDAKLSDEEIYWLREYIEKKYPYAQNANNHRRYSGYGYAAYRKPDWGRADFYEESKKAEWDRKYGFSKYQIDYGVKGKYRLWMLMEQGGICWGLSGLGMVVNEVQGIPSIGTYQPGHEAYLLYKQNEKGQGIWSISDDIFGWKNSYTRWGNGVHSEHRLLLEWGQKEYNKLDRGNNTTYIILAQDALNHYDQYLKSMYYTLIANSYPKTDARHQEALEKSLTQYSKNLDAFYGLYQVYQENSQTTESKWLELAERIAKEYRYFPAPMNDFMSLIESKLTSPDAQLRLTLLRKNTLESASQTRDDEFIQASATRAVANDLLGKEDQVVAKFSFDGEHAGSIMLGDRFQGNQVRWDYSLDGKKTWKETSESKVVLSQAELNQITAENDIYVHIVGSNYHENNLYKIDIQKASRPTNLSVNDLENRLLGVDHKTEWRYQSNDAWKKFQEELPDLNGNKTIEVRSGKSETYLPSDSVTYRFTNENQLETRKYIPSLYLSIHQLSSQQSESEAGRNLIDGNLNTIWHSKHDGSDQEKYVVLKLEDPRYISALEYMPRQTGRNGRIKSAKVFISLDGVNWSEQAVATNWANDHRMKTIELKQSVKAKYIKLQATETYSDNGKSYVSGAMIQLYEDVKKKQENEPFVEYSTTSPTKGTVTAKLKLPAGYQALGESEYQFTSNGSKTFYYRTPSNQILPYGSRVTWIQ